MSQKESKNSSLSYEYNKFNVAITIDCMKAKLQKQICCDRSHAIISHQMHYKK